MRHYWALKRPLQVGTAPGLVDMKLALFGGSRLLACPSAVKLREDTRGPPKSTKCQHGGDMPGKFLKPLPLP